jgi:O-antigen/teichoic acid export membrane protein
MITTLRQRLNNLEAQGFFPIFVLTACVQGTVIGTQLLVTLFLSPSEVGIIRSLESALSVMILVGSFGVQALSIRDVAFHKKLSDQILVLRSIYLLVFLGAFLIIVGIFTMRALWQKSVILDMLLLTSGIVFLTNSIRAATGFAQGAGLVNKIYLPLIPLSIFAVAIQLTITNLWGIPGWIIGRYVSEGVMLLGVAALLYKLITPVAIKKNISLVQIKKLGINGILVNSALMLRVVSDSLPILILTALKVPTDQIGFFGIAVLVVTTASLPLAIVAQRALPLMVMRDGDKETADTLNRYLVRMIMKLALSGSALLTVVSLLLYWVVGGPYALAFLFTAVLCWALPLKGLALAYGTVMMVKRNYVISIWINIFEVTLVAISGFIMINKWGVIGSVFAVIFGSMWSMIAYRYAVRVRIK